MSADRKKRLSMSTDVINNVKRYINMDKSTKEIQDLIGENEASHM